MEKYIITSQGSQKDREKFAASCKNVEYAGFEEIPDEWLYRDFPYLPIVFLLKVD